MGPQLMSTAVHRSPNKLCKSNSIFNLWVRGNATPTHNFYLSATLSESVARGKVNKFSFNPLPGGPRSKGPLKKNWKILAWSGCMVQLTTLESK